MIRLTTTAKSTVEFVRRAKVNILRSQTALVRSLGGVGRRLVQAKAPVWKGTLGGKVALKVFPKTKKAEIMMMSSLYNQIALENEFNIRGRRKLYKSSYPKLGEWADEKGIFQGAPFVIVGGRNTRLGKQNKFFLPAFIELQKRVPGFAARIVAKAIMRTRG